MIDIGANLAHESFADDLDAVLERAGAAGVEQIIVTGSCMDSSRQALALATRHPGHLFATAGLHPHHASEYGAEHQVLFGELLGNPLVVAGGECGLDYFRDLSPRADQRRAFEAQLQLAIAAGKPVFLHQRDAHADFLPILREYRPQLVNAVVHCFTDTAEAMAEYLALDCHIGITGWICDERRGAQLLEAAAQIPAQRLMIETDSPYLLPRNIRPRPKHRRNEPAYLPYVVEQLAAATGRRVQAIRQSSSATAKAFFRLPDRLSPA